MAGSLDCSTLPHILPYPRPPPLPAIAPLVPQAFLRRATRVVERAIIQSKEFDVMKDYATETAVPTGTPTADLMTKKVRCARSVAVSMLGGLRSCCWGSCCRL